MKSNQRTITREFCSRGYWAQMTYPWTSQSIWAFVSRLWFLFWDLKMTEEQIVCDLKVRFGRSFSSLSAPWATWRALSRWTRRGRRCSRPCSRTASSTTRSWSTATNTSTCSHAMWTSSRRSASKTSPASRQRSRLASLVAAAAAAIAPLYRRVRRLLRVASRLSALVSLPARVSRVALLAQSEISTLIAVLARDQISFCWLLCFVHALIIFVFFGYQ